jgi:hypothetical protein
MGQMEEVRWSWLRADPLEDVSVLPRKGNDIDLLRSHSLPSPCHIRQLSRLFCGGEGAAAFRRDSTPGHGLFLSRNCSASLYVITARVVWQ